MCQVDVVYISCGMVISDLLRLLPSYVSERKQCVPHNNFASVFFYIWSASRIELKTTAASNRHHLSADVYFWRCHWRGPTKRPRKSVVCFDSTADKCPEGRSPFIVGIMGPYGLWEIHGVVCKWVNCLSRTRRHCLLISWKSGPGGCCTARPVLISDINLRGGAVPQPGSVDHRVGVTYVYSLMLFCR